MCLGSYINRIAGDSIPALLADIVPLRRSSCTLVCVFDEIWIPFLSAACWEGIYCSQSQLQHIHTLQIHNPHTNFTIILSSVQGEVTTHFVWKDSQSCAKWSDDSLCLKRLSKPRIVNWQLTLFETSGHRTQSGLTTHFGRSSGSTERRHKDTKTWRHLNSDKRPLLLFTYFIYFILKSNLASA